MYNLIQVTDDCESTALFTFPQTLDFDYASTLIEDCLEASQDEDYPLDAAEAMLEKHGIMRVFAEEHFSNFTF